VSDEATLTNLLVAVSRLQGTFDSHVINMNDRLHRIEGQVTMTNGRVLHLEQKEASRTTRDDVLDRAVRGPVSKFGWIILASLIGIGQVAFMVFLGLKR
jgi:hypothetical protein